MTKLRVYCERENSMFLANLDQPQREIFSKSYASEASGSMVIDIRRFEVVHMLPLLHWIRLSV